MHCDECGNCYGKHYEDAAATKEIPDLTKWGIVPALGHTASELNSNSTHHFKVCTRCYTEIEGTKEAHSGGTATCQEKAKCKTCQTAYGSYGEHNLATSVWGFIDPTGHAHMCLTENCSYRAEIQPHRSGGPATEESDEVCLDSGYVIAVAIKHTHLPLNGYQSDGENHWMVCKCGEILEKLAHVDANSDGKCDTCNYGLPLPPDTDETTSAPSTTDETTSVPTTSDETTSPDRTTTEETTTVPDTTDIPSTDTGVKFGVLHIVIIILIILGAGAAVTVILLKKKKYRTKN